jgi:NAD(P)-dependent dehydrogenase (short-subunit alcohol dehydrogenase family)
MSEPYFWNRTAIVTGAASGLGRALAGELARRGAWVYLVDRNDAQCHEAVNAIVDAGGHATAVPLDVTDRQAMSQLIERCVAERGALDYMVNNAGIALLGELRDLDADDLAPVLHVNLHGVVYGTHAAYCAMIPHGGGHIINIASGAGLLPLPGAAIYSASKYGVVGFSLAVRAEGAALGVKVSVVCPGFLDTPMADTMKVVKLHLDKTALRFRFPVQHPAAAARTILHGVVRNQAVIFTPRWGRWLWRLTRWCPTLGERLARRVVLQLRRVRIE